jgi:Ca2+-binding RTX toxin-like protein
MIGGRGDDIYVVDNAGDVVTEVQNEGADTVQAGITYTLGANVENLTLTGAAAVNGTGNDGNNVLVGNSAANRLSGGAGDDTLDGGAGADTLVGGQGNDTYGVDDAGDVVTESLNEGTDTVQAGITYTLGATVENLTLTGSAAINGTGNDGNNVLVGNSAANRLSGGAGDDTLDGGAGADTLIGRARQRHLWGGQRRRCGDRRPERRHRHRAGRHHIHVGRHSREPHAHGQRSDQRHG